RGSASRLSGRSSPRSGCTRASRCCSPRCGCGASGREMRRIRFLIWKELIELRQDPRLLVIVVMAPIIQLFMLAYAATTDVRDVPVVVADMDRSAESRELIRRFAASPNFSLVDVVTGVNQIDPFLERGTAWIAVAIPTGYGRTLAAGRPATVQMIADGSDSNSA